MSPAPRRVLDGSSTIAAIALPREGDSVQTWTLAVTARAPRHAAAVFSGWAPAPAGGRIAVGRPAESAGARLPYHSLCAPPLAPRAPRGQAACCIPSDANASEPPSAIF